MSEGLRDVLAKCLIKDSDSRIDMDELMKHRWLTLDGLLPIDMWDVGEIQVTQEDIDKAIVKLKLETGIFVAAKMKGRFSRAKSRVAAKSLINAVAAKSEVSNGLGCLVNSTLGVEALVVRSSPKRGTLPPTPVEEENKKILDSELANKKKGRFSVCLPPKKY